MGKRKFSIILILAILFLVSGFFFMPKNTADSEIINFNIEKGTGSGKVASDLEKEGIIRSRFIFRVYILIAGISKKIQAGNYEISQSMSIFQIAKKFSEGDVAGQQITIIEGWNLRNIGSYLEQKDLLKKEDFWKVAGSPAKDYSETDASLKPKDFSDKYDFLEDKPDNVGLEGYLFPDTYSIGNNAGSEEIIEKMLDNFGKKLAEDLRQEIKKQNKTIFEVVTMASLIEKEVKSYQDKQIVSGIFWKRLDAGMTIDSCASISYILGQDKKQYSFDDTRTPSPFNTYLNAGLPLGPISNPGIESIKAAIYPKDSPYWYFLSASDGRTIFSKTLYEHNIAKAKYLE